LNEFDSPIVYIASINADAFLSVALDLIFIIIAN